MPWEQVWSRSAVGRSSVADMYVYAEMPAARPGRTAPLHTGPSIYVQEVMLAVRFGRKVPLARRPDAARRLPLRDLTGVQDGCCVKKARAPEVHEPHHPRGGLET